MSLLESKSRSKLLYRYLSTVYDSVNSLFWTERMLDETVSMLDLAEGDSVLDVGCGTGFATKKLHAVTGDVTAIDQSPHQLAKATPKFADDEVAFHLGDAERLPFESDAFDVVWSSGSIEYWPNPVATLRELRRVASPGGAVLVVGPETPDLGVCRRIADSIMLFYDERDADRMFRVAGFTSVDHRILQSHPGAPRAIATLAAVPSGDADRST